MLVATQQRVGPCSAASRPHPPQLTAPTRPTRAPTSQRPVSCAATISQCPVLLLPGFLFSADQYKEPRRRLEQLGHPTRVVPLSTHTWLPTLAGGSFRFYLELLLPVLDDLHAQHGPVALVGHSAGGWIARLLLGDALYEGRSWHRSEKVCALVTLGTPHQSQELYPFGRIQERRSGERPDLPSDVQGSSLRFVNHHYPTAASHLAVPMTCIVGKTIRGVKPPHLLAFDAAGVAYTSYKANTGDGAEWGDGVCPLHTALVPGATVCVMEGVWHAPLASATRLWYGSKRVVDYWERFLPQGQEPLQPGQGEAARAPLLSAGGQLVGASLSTVSGSAL